MKLSRKFGLLSLVLCVLFLAGSALASGFPSPERAPINPEFLKHQENQSVNDGMRRFTGEINRQGGYVPSPLDMSHLRNADYSAFLERAKGMRGDVFPTAYDLRTLNRVTSVKDQGLYGVCWAFAALGSVESQYLVQGGGAKDLSEMHLGWFAFKDTVSFKSNTPDPLQNGGNNFMSTALEMTRQGFGITLCLPYMPEVIDWVSANGLQMRPLAQPVKMRRFFIYQRSSRGLSPASIAFKQFLQAYFASHFDDLQSV